MKRQVISLMAMLASFKLSYANEPLLVDVKVTGATQSPLFEPQHFQFDLNQDYMMVITNNSSDALTFEYDTFGQNVATRSLQGTSSVTQSSLVINGHSKVQWHFSPQVVGEYPYYVINTGLNSHGSPGKLVVKKMEDINQIQDDAQLKEQASHRTKLASRF